MKVIKAVCTHKREAFPDQIVVGETYYIKNEYELDGEKYGEVYSDKDCDNFIARMLTSHFKRKNTGNGKILIVIDMQNDFVTGSLGTKEAQEVVGNIKKLAQKHAEEGSLIMLTQDTHEENYPETLEGKKLPVKHCISNTEGWQIVSELKEFICEDESNLWTKGTFGCKDLLRHFEWSYMDKEVVDGDDSEVPDIEIEICGVCTDICVVSNALMLRMEFPNSIIKVNASCCAGTTPENHGAALQVMRSCQIDVI